jgi:hypothetical protein
VCGVLTLSGDVDPDATALEGVLVGVEVAEAILLRVVERGIMLVAEDDARAANAFALRLEALAALALGRIEVLVTFQLPRSTRLATCTRAHIPRVGARLSKA